MKNLFKTIHVLLFSTAILFMYSCQDEEDSVSQEQSGVEFLLAGHQVGDAKNLGVTAKDGEDDQVVCDMSLASYAVLNLGGTDYNINLKAWGDSFKTDLIELDPGTYEVSSFQLYDENDLPLYATPATGSEFGPFVSQSVPFDVTVSQYQKTEYDLEVLCVEDFTPPQFGFVFWDVSIKEVKNLCVFANFCEPDTGHEVATLEAFIYPDENSTEDSDLIWTGFADGDYASEEEDNDLLCLKFPFDPSIDAGQQSYYVELFINDVLFYGTMPLDRVDSINANSGYLHLNENCQGDFDVFSNSYNIAWEALNGDDNANDADFNDLIVETTSFTDDNGLLNFVFEPLARSAGSDLEFKFWLPGTGYVVTGDAFSVDSSSGDTEIVVYQDTRQSAFGTNNGFVNGKCGGNTGSGIIKSVIVDVSSAPDFAYFLLNPYSASLGVNGNNGTFDLDMGEMFMPSTFTKDGQVMKNGLITPKDWKWVVDQADVRDTYGNNFETEFVVLDSY